MLHAIKIPQRNRSVILWVHLPGKCLKDLIGLDPEKENCKLVLKTAEHSGQKKSISLFFCSKLCVLWLMGLFCFVFNL